MGKGFLSYAAAVILQSVSSGYLYGFDIIDITGLPGGTVYPALRRLEEAGYLTSKWEHAEYLADATAAGAQVLRADPHRPGGTRRCAKTLPDAGAATSKESQ